MYTMALIRRIIAVQAFFFLIHSPIITTSSHSPKEGRSIHIKLFHRDSPPSPFHNPNESPTEKANKSFKRSIPCHAYLSGMEITGNAFQGGIEAENGEYLVKFSIGSPPFEILAIMDTASDLVWTQCLPCDHCHNQLNSIILDPSKSSTCTNLTCNTPSCTLLPNWNCDSSNWCHYIYSCTDFSHSKGLLATDVFTFETSDEGTFPLHNIVFGCGHDNENTSPNGRDTGILGLGNHNLSLISQMGSIIESKFTYCFGNHSNPNIESHLVLGNGVFSEGQTTPPKIINGRYHLTLEGISVGEKRLAISSETFSYYPFGGGGVIIDTGTLLTSLAQDAYYRLVEELEEQLGLEMDILPDPPYGRCYNGKISNINGYGGVKFHFARGLDVVLDRWNLFLQVKGDEFCLAFLPSLGRASVVGNLFQQFFSVGYDLVSKVVFL